MSKSATMSEHLDEIPIGNRLGEKDFLTELINRPLSQVSILNDIATERVRQDAKHGDPFQKSYDRLLAVIAEEFGEAATEINDLASGHAPVEDFEQAAIIELVQTAACCVQMVEVIKYQQARRQQIARQMAAGPPEPIVCAFGKRHAHNCDCYM